MRRKTYSELLAAAQNVQRGSVSHSQTKPALARPGLARPGFSAPPAIRASAAPKAEASTLSAEASKRCRAEIRLLSAMIDKHRVTADGDGQKMCLFADEKVAQALMALESGDGDSAWVQLFGAAMLCRTFQILPEEAEKTMARLNSMLV